MTERLPAPPTSFSLRSMPKKRMAPAHCGQNVSAHIPQGQIGKRGDRWYTLKENTMSRVESLEGQVKQLPAEELRAFREWFVQFDAEVWGRQFESDVQNGKLDELSGRALRDYKPEEAGEL
jgi:hypothetical protein